MNQLLLYYDIDCLVLLVVGVYDGLVVGTGGGSIVCSGNDSIVVVVLD